MRHFHPFHPLGVRKQMVIDPPGEEVKIVASMAIVRGCGIVRIQPSSSRRVDLVRSKKTA